MSSAEIPSEQACLSLNNLALHYEDHILFENFSFQLEKNTCYALLGASGVGKSTLLRLIAKLPTGCSRLSGEILPHNISENISYMSQQTALLPWLTVLDNILIGKKLRHEKITAEDKQDAAELLQRVQLSHAIKFYPQQLSGGMQQRVALARTLFENKAIVLLDEPFSALDVITRLSLQEITINLLRDKTVLLVTHDPLEALRIADKVYVLRGQPAVLSAAILPSGVAPRKVNDEALIKQQAILLELLRAQEILC